MENHLLPDVKRGKKKKDAAQVPVFVSGKRDHSWKLKREGLCGACGAGQRGRGKGAGGSAYRFEIAKKKKKRVCWKNHKKKVTTQTSCIKDKKKRDPHLGALLK